MRGVPVLFIRFHRRAARLKRSCHFHPFAETAILPMHEMKDTVRALVRIGYDGRVHKTFRGHLARERFENEVRVLRHLEQRGCNFVPRLLEVHPAELKIVTTNCGSIVEQLGEAHLRELFAELGQFGVRHDDPFMRNVTYRTADGRFCVIDFELATLLDAPPAPPPGHEPKQKSHPPRPLRPGT
jgi:tRNA A-37 threonylcarbamoyl transferase component Bud32